VSHRNPARGNSARRGNLPRVAERKADWAPTWRPSPAGAVTRSTAARWGLVDKLRWGPEDARYWQVGPGVYGASATAWRGDDTWPRSTVRPIWFSNRINFISNRFKFAPNIDRSKRCLLVLEKIGNKICIERAWDKEQLFLKKLF
jgi:hypothetical protein